MLKRDLGYPTVGGVYLIVDKYHGECTVKVTGTNNKSRKWWDVRYVLETTHGKWSNDYRQCRLKDWHAMRPERKNVLNHKQIILALCGGGIEAMHKLHAEHNLLDESNHAAVQQAMEYLSEVKDEQNALLLHLFLWSAAGFPFNLLPNPKRQTLKGNPNCIQLNMTPLEAGRVRNALGSHRDDEHINNVRNRIIGQLKQYQAHKEHEAARRDDHE